jgi:predicted ATPase
MKRWISRLSIENLRSFVEADINPSEGINIIVGRNNSGKSTLLQSILLLQTPSFTASDRRKMTEADSSILIEYSGLDIKLTQTEIRRTQFQISSTRYKTNHMATGFSSGTQWPKKCCFSNIEPENLIYPYLSKRKVGSFEENVSSSIAYGVRGNFSNLYAKVDRVSNPTLPAYESYRKACIETIGFLITATTSPNGKKAVYTIGNYDSIPIDAMGEGISNILGMIVDLCMAEDKIFLIEEPENDIHPKALKALLDLICERANNNQFFITTHSNIVLKHLGAHSDNKIFRVDMEFQNRLPISSVKEIDQSQRAKREILEDLGYELYDFDLWSGWLFLEESSAEKIIRQYLIPWFTPKLVGKLRTFSARSRDEVAAKFEDFNRLFVFLHLEESYRDRVWVVIDDGDKENKIIKEFQKKYRNWEPDQFQTWTEHDFESYYPKNFQDRVKQVLSMNSKDKKKWIRKKSF